MTSTYLQKGIRQNRITTVCDDDTLNGVNTHRVFWRQFILGHVFLTDLFGVDEPPLCDGAVSGPKIVALEKPLWRWSTNYWKRPKSAGAGFKDLTC